MHRHCKKILYLLTAVPMLFGAACNKRNSSRPDAPEAGKSTIACLPGSLGSGVLAYYPFSNGSLLDFSGNGHDLSNGTSAAPAGDRSGGAACAFGFHNFTRPGDMLSLTNTGFLDSASTFSVSLWYYAEDSTRDPALYEGLICQGTGFDCPDRMGNWSLGLYDSRRPVFGMYQSVWDHSELPATIQPLYAGYTNIWKHLTITYDRNKKNAIAIYVNGVLQQSASGVAPCTPLPNVVRGGALRIGVGYNGRIDDVIIYNRVLTPAEISNLHQLSPCCSVS